MKKNTLSDFVETSDCFSRSINIERDLLEASIVQQYRPTTRAREAVWRIAEAITLPRANRAWTLVGPYGSGKSAFAAWLTGLLGSQDEPAFTTANTIAAQADPSLVETVQAARKAAGPSAGGMVLAVATAQREPIAKTIARALRIGVGRAPRGLGSARFVELLEHDEDPVAVRDAVRLVSSRRPVILLIDEFGKNLEYAAGNPSDGDLFLLQQIAEDFSGVSAHKSVVLTLQHMSTGDYMAGLSAAQRREWSKVQGRFEEIPFLESSDQTLELVRSVFTMRAPTKALARMLREWKDYAAAQITLLGLAPRTGTDMSLVFETYPVHPLLLAILPELVSRHGQNERSLFDFLAGPQEDAVPAFMRTAELNGPLPVVGLARAYDFFCGSEEAGGSARNNPRWHEVRAVVRDAALSVGPDELEVLKSAALLNLVSTGGALRSSEAMLKFAVAPLIPSAEADRALSALQSSGRLLYRRFADEFRLWEGSDFDIETELDFKRNHARTAELETALNQTSPMRPVVAQRHAHTTGTLRVFERRFLVADELGQASLEAASWADGLIAYVLQSPQQRVGHVPSQLPDGRPLVVAVSPHRHKVEEAAIEATAVSLLLAECRRAQSEKAVLAELRQRALASQAALSDRVQHAFAFGMEELSWFSGGQPIQVPDVRDLSSLLSGLCDSCYQQGLILQNEMLNRERLTSQGAKARRELLEALVLNKSQPALGIVGYGPDRSMYESVFRASGMHVEGEDGTWILTEPDADSGIRAVWDAIVGFLVAADEKSRRLSDLFEVVALPPYGVRTGPIPVLIVAALLTLSEDVALYQEGTFEPTLSPETIERLIKAPDKFSVRFVNVTGSRAHLLQVLVSALGARDMPAGRLRNAGLISAVGPLWGLVKGLPDYALRTRSLSPATSKVRAALRSAREPESLVFEELPIAVGLKPFTARRQYADREAKEYAKRLVDCLSELGGAYRLLLEGVQRQIGESLCPGVPFEAVREDIAVRAAHLEGKLLNQRLKAFVGFATSPDLPMAEWLEAIAMSATDKSPRFWRDEDADIFAIRLKELASQFLRTELLWHERATHDLERRGFQAYRLSVTAQDGVEIDDVVWIDEKRTECLSALVASTLETVDQQLGESDRTVFLAALARELLSSRAESERDSTSTLPTDKSVGGRAASGE